MNPDHNRCGHRASFFTRDRPRTYSRAMKEATRRPAEPEGARMNESGHRLTGARDGPATLSERRLVGVPLVPSRRSVYPKPSRHPRAAKRGPDSDSFPYIFPLFAAVLAGKPPVLSSASHRTDVTDY